ncbi:MAG TPA: hypothetical protein VG738_23095 [Chitinophagaceae bacterium]|nr:hypothetical protein [Chitinophagaceae bacterium]
MEDLDSCIHGKPIDPFLIRKLGLHYSFPEAYGKSIDSLVELISKRRTKIFMSTNHWLLKRRNKERLIVYITPIKGTFCSSPLAETGAQRTGYKGDIYLPLANFSYDDSFWHSTSLKLIKHQSFEKIDFRLILTPF